jgi:hypothetical protein
MAPRGRRGGPYRRRGKEHNDCPSCDPHGFTPDEGANLLLSTMCLSLRARLRKLLLHRPRASTGAGMTVGAGQGPRVRALAYVSRHSPQAAKRSHGVVLDVVNLTRWSLCFRRQTIRCRVLTLSDRAAVYIVEHHRASLKQGNGSARLIPCAGAAHKSRVRRSSTNPAPKRESRSYPAASKLQGSSAISWFGSSSA